MTRHLLALTFFAFAGTSQAQIQNYTVGQTVANFTVTDLHGDTHTLYNITSTGKYVLLDFYAYWCGPCCSTAPIIKDFYTKYGCNQGDVYVLGLEGDGTTAQAETFETNCVGGSAGTYPTCAGLDGGADPVHVTYGPAAYPTICLIGPDNKILNLDIWPVGSVASLEAAFPSGAITPMTCSTTSSVEDLLTDYSMAMYPNPAVDQITLALNLSQRADIKVDIYNNVGKLVLSQNMGSHSVLNQNIDVTALENGSYHAKVTVNNGETKTIQFVVAR